ncbi:MAG TPA: hypothetical protein VK835_02575 [Bacteroidia bacterium]|nr:hypothetical protein [Bacteroidia bacterium]
MKKVSLVVVAALLSAGMFANNASLPKKETSPDGGKKQKTEVAKNQKQKEKPKEKTPKTKEQKAAQKSSKKQNAHA